MAEGKLTFEGARLIFRNFSGTPTKFKKDGGERSFAVAIDEETARRLIADGWNAKIRPSKFPDEPPRCHLTVKVSFGKRPPKIVVVKGNKQTLLTEETVGGLDWAEIVKADVAVRPYNWENNGAHGVAAYLKTLYVTIEEDEFENKYADGGYPDESDDDIPF